MKRKIISIITVLCLVMCLVPLMPANEAAAANIIYNSGYVNGICPTTYQMALGMLNEAGYDCDYWVFFESNYYKDDDGLVRYSFYGHSDSTHPYFVLDNVSLDVYNSVAIYGNLNIKTNEMNSCIYVYDALNSSVSSSIFDYTECIIYANVPILATRNDANIFMAGGTDYTCRDYIDCTEEEYSSNVPAPKNAYISYRDGNIYINFDFPAEAANYEANIYASMNAFISTKHYLFSGWKKTEYKYLTQKYKYTTIPYSNQQAKVLFDSDFINTLAEDIETQDKSVYAVNGSMDCAACKYIKHHDIGVNMLDTDTVVTIYIYFSQDKSTGDIVRMSFNLAQLLEGDIYYEGTIQGTVDIIDGTEGLEGVDSSQIKDSVHTGSNYTNYDFTNTIQNGLGLIGNNGTISLMASVFSFIPSEVWTLIISVIGAACVIIILKFARG